MTLKVYSIGTPVRVGENFDVRGRVQGISIRQSGVSYLVTWWDGLQYREEWLFEHDVRDDPHVRYSPAEIGFHTCTSE